MSREDLVRILLPHRLVARISGLIECSRKDEVKSGNDDLEVGRKREKIVISIGRIPRGNREYGISVEAVLALWIT